MLEQSSSPSTANEFRSTLTPRQVEEKAQLGIAEREELLADKYYQLAWEKLYQGQDKTAEFLFLDALEICQKIRPKIYAAYQVLHKNNPFTQHPSNNPIKVILENKENTVAKSKDKLLEEKVRDVFRNITTRFGTNCELIRSRTDFSILEQLNLSVVEAFERNHIVNQQYYGKINNEFALLLEEKDILTYLEKNFKNVFDGLFNKHEFTKIYYLYDLLSNVPQLYEHIKKAYLNYKIAFHMQTEKAILNLLYEIKTNPENPQLYLQCALFCEELRYVSLGLSSLSHYIRITQDPKGVILRATTAIKADMPDLNDLILSDGRYLLQKKIFDKIIYQYVFKTLVKKSCYQEALTFLNALLNSNPQDPVFLKDRAHCNFQLGNFNETKKDLELALSFVPKTSDDLKEEIQHLLAEARLVLADIQKPEIKSPSGEMNGNVKSPINECQALHNPLKGEEKGQENNAASSDPKEKAKSHFQSFLSLWRKKTDDCRKAAELELALAKSLDPDYGIIEVVSKHLSVEERITLCDSEHYLQLKEIMLQIQQDYATGFLALQGKLEHIPNEEAKFLLDLCQMKALVNNDLENHELIEALIMSLDTKTMSPGR